MHRRLRAALSLPLLALALALPLAGCGGSGDDSGSSGGGTTVETATTGIDLAWGARSRDVEAPASALSARVTFAGGAADGTDVAFTVNRRSDPAAYSSTYGAPTRVKTGGVTLRVAFYAGANATGAVVGTAETGAILKSDGTLARADGRPLGTVSTVGTIVTVAIVAPATVAVGATVQLAVTARDAAGNLVAITPGSATFATNYPALTVTPVGLATGVAVGNATVTVTLDGRSTYVDVTVVRAANAGIIEVDQPVNGLVFSLGQNRILATTPGSGPNPNRLVAFVPSTGAINRSLALGSNPGPIALSADGNVAYVGITGAGTVRRVDLRTNAIGAPISLGVEPGFPESQRAAGDLAVSPLDPNVFVAVTFPFNGGFGRRLLLFRNGAEAPNSVPNNDASVIDFAPGSEDLYGYNGQSSSFDLFRFTVDADGITQAQRSGGSLSGYATRIEVAGGRIYGGDGHVADAATLARIGEFAIGSTNGVPFALDTVARRIYFFTPSTNGEGQIAIFDIDTFDGVGVKRLSGITPTSSNSPALLALAGANRLALATPDGKLYFLDLARL